MSHLKNCFRVFCLAFYVFTFLLLMPTTYAQSEDCLPYNPQDLRVEDEGADGWLLTDGFSRMLILDNEADAQEALAIVQRHTAQCFVGRDTTRSDRSTYVHQYWQGDSGIETTIAQTDCLPYNPTNLTIQDEGESGWLLTDGTMAMVLLDTEADAEILLNYAKQQDMQCFIGRNNSRPNRLDYIVEYWLSSQEPVTTVTFNGIWVNENPNTDGITQVEFLNEGSELYIRAWGACSPTDCEWGEEKVTLTNEGVPSVTWNQGFAVLIQQLAILSDGRLLVNTFTHFVDDSGRDDYASIEYFLLQGSAIDTPTQSLPP